MTRAPRYAVSALAGTAAAVSMLWLMQLLVTSPSQQLPTVDSQRLVDFVRLKREEKLQLKERTPPPPPRKAAPPPRPRLDLRADTQPPSPQLDMDMNLDVPLNFGDDTQRALASGTEMDPKVRDWAANFLMERFDTSLD